MNHSLFYGVHTALVTPMQSGKVCLKSLEKLVEFQISQGINGILVLGTTGETPTVSPDEKLEIIKTAQNVTQGRVPIMVGATSNCTSHAVQLTQQATEANADAILSAAPYYNKPTQEGLFQHFSAIAEATSKPIILYSIPSRCGIEIGVSIIARLREKYPNIIAVKEAGGCCSRVYELKQALDDDFIILSGDDPLTLPFMSLGAKGVISVASNLIVKDLVHMVQLALNNNFAEASAINNKYYPFFKNIFVETNPIPIKHALFKSNIIQSPEVRLPLVPLSSSGQTILEDTLTTLNL